MSEEYDDKFESLADKKIYVLLQIANLNIK